MKSSRVFSVPRKCDKLGHGLLVLKKGLAAAITDNRAVVETLEIGAASLED